jgi:hypothetical protein
VNNIPLFMLRLDKFVLKKKKGAKAPFSITAVLSK